MKAAIESIGAELRVWPPESPDLNPIENAFGKLKSKGRAAQKRTMRTLQNYLGAVLDGFIAKKCANDYKSCGYRDATPSREPF